MDEEEFKGVVYAAMQHVFDVHSEIGRLFDEKIYQAEVARRIGDARREAPIEVTFEDFTKTYYLDLLVRGGAIFEFKAVETLNERHRGQLLNYLFLTDLPHGKLVNLRRERVQHEFVNAPARREDRTAFAVVDDGWNEMDGLRLKDRMTAMLRDWGTGLDLGLYQEAAMHLCGRAGEPECMVEIRLDGRTVGSQPVPLASAETALRVTCLPPDRRAGFEAHLRRFLSHTTLRSLQWINITRAAVQFKSIV
jgi:GxxExxY protein